LFESYQESINQSINQLRPRLLNKKSLLTQTQEGFTIRMRQILDLNQLDMKTRNHGSLMYQYITIRPFPSKLNIFCLFPCYHLQIYIPIPQFE